MPEPKVLSQSHDVSPEEKAIELALKEAYEALKKDLPNLSGRELRKRWADYDKFSTLNCARLYRLSEQRLNKQYGNLPSTADSIFHIHDRTKGSCKCEA